jgi:dolichyl-diphosphooligosaccharide--protein glycosyltransferase/undecaprenyl-diphosphooligosaccharide--protein glycosyltransferase
MGSVVSSPFNYLLISLLIIAVYFLIKDREFDKKMLYILSAIAVIGFMYFGDVFLLIYNKVSSYLNRGIDSEGLHFFQVQQTVREAGVIPFSTMANRISGSTVGVIVSLIGYVLLVIRYRPFILALPLIGIGVFSLMGGLRFTVFAVAIAAMSAVYLFYVIAGASDKKPFRYAIITILTALMIYPNISHILGYKVPTVFTNDEVKVLKALDKMASEKDYTLTWWDYGYPIWYYSDTNTLIDGGKHSHDNYIISKIMNTSSQTQAANLSRLAVEKYVKSGDVVADEIFKDIDPNDLLDELKSDTYKLPEKTRDIYLFLPNRMLNIFPTVGLFSNLDLKTGKRGEQPFFYKADRFKDDGDVVHFGNGLAFEKRTGVLHIGQNKTEIKRLVMVGYDKNQKLQKDIQSINPNAEISIIFMQSYGSFLILDESMYNSLFIQLFVLEEYDKNLFEAVISSPYAKVYKIKR